MPFGDYESMDDCIAQNQDKDNPGGYCRAIEKAITGKGGITQDAWNSYTEDQKKAFMNSLFQKEVEDAKIHKIAVPQPTFNLSDYIDYQLLQNRTVVFQGAVYGWNCKEASQRLEYLAKENTEPIKVILNSIGGSVFDGMLVHDTIKSLVQKGIPVEVEARGLAASMGCILLQAGSTRKATKHTRFLIHEVSTAFWGKSSDFQDEAEELKKVNDMLKTIISDRSGKTPEEIEKVWHRKDVWMSAEEALNFGLIDEIVEEPTTFMEGVGLSFSESAAITAMSPPVPMKLHLFTESINFDGKEVSGIAIHPKRIWHPEEGVSHDYLKEELELAAETSRTPVPFGEDHIRNLSEPNEAHTLFYDKEQNGVGFRGTVSSEIAKNIENKVYKGCSIELNWFRKGVILEKTNGLAPRNFEITKINFMKRFPPGDADAYVRMWEGIVLPVVPPPIDIQIDQLRRMFEDRLTRLEGAVQALTGSKGFQQASAPAVIIFKESQAEFMAEIGEMRTALSELDSLKEAIRAKEVSQQTEFLNRGKVLADKIEEYTKGIKELDERLKTFSPDGKTVVELRKKLYTSEQEVNKLEREKRDDERRERAKYNKLHDDILSILPPPRVWMSWRASGPKIMVQKILGVLGVKPEDYFS